MNRAAAILTVYEQQVLSERDFALASDFAWLLEQDFEVFTLTRKLGQWGLCVRHYIGVVRLPSGTLLEILPKIAQPAITPAEQTVVESQHLYRTRAWIQRMLSIINNSNGAALRPKHLQQLTPQLQAYNAAVPPLSEWLLAEFIEQLAHYNPLKQYASQEQNSSSLQGKLLLKQHLQYNAQQPHRFYSEMTQFEQTALSNRFIKQAWQLVVGMVFGLESTFTQSSLTSASPISAPQATQLLTEQAAKPNAEPTAALRARTSPLLTRWRPIGLLTAQEQQRLADSYNRALTEIKQAPIALLQRQRGQQLLALAYGLLKANTPIQPAGVGLQDPEHHLSSQPNLQLSLFINMHHAFEAWVSSVLAQQFYERDPQYQVQAQPQRPWLVDEAGAPCVTVMPDLYIRYQQQPSHIIDMKWKAIRSSRDIKASDAYQLAAYAQAYQVAKVWLVYPVSQPVLATDPYSATDFDKTSKHNAHPIRLNTQTLTEVEVANIANQNDLEVWLVPFNVDSGEVIIFNQNKYYDLF
jgi:5-methylcytosine-specific restriction enzyme subunit McrC